MLLQGLEVWRHDKGPLKSINGKVLKAIRLSDVAFLQIYMDGATGHRHRILSNGFRDHLKRSKRKTCHSQKAISTAHLSFCVLGLSFLLIPVLLINLLSIFIEPVARFVQTRGKLSPYSRLEWDTNGVFQLQRLAHEERGIGEWTAADKTIPETKPPISLVHLNISNLEHPPRLL
ncbi:hypothetical protein F4860DRAFT_518157 [Xylaria cubensis]|nr:hypothetical protein F4860DRAFT_518157 [Xylaria cubensis]